MQKDFDQDVYQRYQQVTAPDKQKDPEYEARSPSLLRGLGSWLSVKDRRVLDLGCGDGLLCWICLEQGASKVVGIDMSTEDIELAQSQSLQADFQARDFFEFLRDCEDNSFDVVFLMNVLEHQEVEEGVKLLNEVNRVLDTIGEVIVMVPNATSPFGSMTRYWDVTHKAAFTQSSLRQIQRLCGFESAEFREWGPVPHGLISFVRYLLWQMVWAGIALRLFVETGSSKGGVYTADMLCRLIKNA